MNDIETYKWSYLTEGGKHVLFSCEQQACLLRLDKSDLLGGKEKQTDCTELFLSHYLAPYISVPMRVPLTPQFAERLLHEALGCGRIPDSRKKDWKSTKETKQTKAIIGQLVNDARIWHFSPQETKKQLSFSVEIKPKAGYRCVSPLVDPRRRMKYQFPRFRLVQELRGSMSPYNPLDLFSGDLGRIEHAIRALIQCPQNNLKIWNEKELCDMKGDEWLGNALPTVISHVLCKEPCLAKVLELQKLDVLDGDGAILLFKHVVDLCHGQEKVAIDLIDSSWDVASDRSVSILPGSPINMARPSHALSLLCEKIERFSQELDKVWPDLPSSTFLDGQRQEALDLLHQLDRDDSVFLLQNWLLSLCLCDISVFITFSSVSNHADPWEISPNSCNIERLQEADVPGLLALQSFDRHSGNCTISLEYYVHVIDFDQKPASKLRSRHLKENGFDGIKLNN